MKFYTIKETVKLLNVKERTIRSWLQKGILTGKKYNGVGKVYISEDEINRKLADLK